jgi:hypothetical protein
MSKRKNKWIQKREELTRLGLLRDSGRRKDVQIVWELTELGRQVFESEQLGAEHNPTKRSTDMTAQQLFAAAVEHVDLGAKPATIGEQVRRLQQTRTVK